MSTETDEQIRADLRRFRELSKKAGELQATADKAYAQWSECLSDANAAKHEVEKFLVELADRSSCTCPALSGYERPEFTGHVSGCPEART